jgi:hypothetical protein
MLSIDYNIIVIIMTQYNYHNVYLLEDFLRLEPQLPSYPEEANGFTSNNTNLPL